MFQFVAEEANPCKKDTFRDCLQVEMLGKGEGLYNFQNDIGSKPFKAHCEWRIPAADTPLKYVFASANWDTDPTESHRK